MAYVKHARNCRDRDGCPFDAHPCDCWRAGCEIVLTPKEQARAEVVLAQGEIEAWERQHIA